MCNEFTFHGVGQGLFYSGFLYSKKYNFIYDCGTFDNCRKAVKKETIQNEIINKKFDNVELDFIAISHLHEDHVNLLPSMIKKLKKYGKIYLPYFPNNLINTFKSYLAISDIMPDSDVYQLLHVLYGINLESQSENGEYQQYISRVQLIRSEFSQNPIDIPDYSFTIPSDLTMEYEGEKFSYRPNWIFKFYNKIASINILNNIEEAIKQQINNTSSKNLEDYINNNGIDELKKIYEYNLGYNHNITSLILIHYPENGPATLLTGDAEFDNTLESRILAGISDKNKQKCSDLKVFQIPHHGSTKNWNLITGDWKYFPDKLVCSFGWPNSHGHPSSIFYTKLKNEKLLEQGKKTFDINQLTWVYRDNSLCDDEKEHFFKYIILSKGDYLHNIFLDWLFFYERIDDDKILILYNKKLSNI